ncbi:carboxypeptidase M32 [Clostridium tarantellae]|uniref:Metal-dependent carboxypeptidase n=1 Tax=Clostridium tarantellae TaxID=39493 RepID=A0A6I1MJN5_9CLOT|nr:carboxypeptidase M32 [Clostridium tarantellae]MPQ43154.1 carboxypeptidase M32 [Clostridium tarantellae]
MEDLDLNLRELKEHLKNISYLSQALGLIEWDMRVGIPKKAIESRIKVSGYLSSELFKLVTSSKIEGWLHYFDDKFEQLSFNDKKMIKKLKKDYDKFIKIPSHRNKEYIMLCSTAEAFWETAKYKNDFEGFKPYLEKILDFTKEFAGYRGFKKDIYNFCLDDYEEGLTTEKLDKVFNELRDGIVELLNKIKISKVEIDDSFFKQYFNKNDQHEFGKFVLDKIGYDFEAGRLDTTVHPFTCSFGNKDVRITTNYDENDFRSAFFSNIHEGGHGIYDQNSDDKLENTGLSGGTSMSVHESQSRYYENILGRSKEFWMYFYPKLQKTFPQFKNITIDKFYKGINKVESSLIRVEADELTYSIHIIIRYELERALLNNEITVEELPEKWNEKYKKYLGIEPKIYSQGVLQDVHWSAGLIGYFPSYALGNLYGAQFLYKMKKDIPNYSDEIKNGNFKIISHWLKENIHKYGCLYTPSELIIKVTGEELNPKYFLEYLNNKYSKIYELKNK